MARRGEPASGSRLPAGAIPDTFRTNSRRETPSPSLGSQSGQMIRGLSDIVETLGKEPQPGGKASRTVRGFLLAPPETTGPPNRIAANGAPQRPAPPRSNNP